jgi:signal transduction histidine kinase
MINFLITTDLTSEQLDYVHTVQQSADALLLVINDILDLSKVEAGMMKLEMEPFSVHAMTEGANELLSTLAIQKGLELGFLVEDEVPEVVVGDRVRLRQVLINIIGVSGYNPYVSLLPSHVFFSLSDICSLERRNEEGHIHRFINF